MTRNIIMERGDESGDYTVFDAATVAGTQAAKGFALLSEVADRVGDYVEIEISEDGDDLVLEKVTSATGRYSTEAGAVRHIYIDHDVLAEVGGEATDDGFDAPETLGLSISPATEEDFEDSQETPEEAESEADSLLSDVGDEDAVETEEADETEEAEALMEEAEAAAE